MSSNNALALFKQLVLSTLSLSLMLEVTTAQAVAENTRYGYFLECVSDHELAQQRIEAIRRYESGDFGQAFIADHEVMAILDSCRQAFQNQPAPTAEYDYKLGVSALNCANDLYRTKNAHNREMAVPYLQFAVNSFSNVTHSSAPRGYVPPYATPKKGEQDVNSQFALPPEFVKLAAAKLGLAQHYLKMPSSLTRQSWFDDLSASGTTSEFNQAQAAIGDASCAEPYAQARVIKRVAPEFPSGVLLTHRLTANVRLDANGVVQEVTIGPELRNGDDPSLVQSIVNAAQRATYSAERRHCQPVPSTLIVTFGI